MDEKITLPMSRWTLRCTNPDCNGFFEQQKTEPDSVCSKCGSPLDVTEKITFRFIED